MRKDPVRKSTGGTAGRVLDLALEQFNDRGVERVTTRLIAEAAGINEGNLYYHFRTKEALVLALFRRFEAEVLPVFATPPSVATAATEGAAELEPYAALLRQWFLLCWRYRFLFRDLLFLQAAAPSLKEPLQSLSVRLQEATRAVFEAMGRDGLIAVPGGVLDVLLANLWIVSTYWISYLALHGGVGAVTPDHLAWGLRQVRGLYAPYLTEAARSWIASNPEADLLPSG